jgi:hypothetical protein
MVLDPGFKAVTWKEYAPASPAYSANVPEEVAGTAELSLNTRSVPVTVIPAPAADALPVTVTQLTVLEK